MLLERSVRLNQEDFMADQSEVSKCENSDTLTMNGDSRYWVRVKASKRRLF